MTRTPLGFNSFLVGGILAFSLLLQGCIGSGFSHRNFKATLLDGTKVVQKGNVVTPLKTETSMSESTLVIPDGTKIALDENTNMLSIDIAHATQMFTKKTVEKVTAPVPSGEPSLTEQAQATGTRWFWAISAACGLLCILAVYLGHVKAGLFLLGAAIGFPVLGKVVSLVAAYAWLFCLLGIAGALVWAWYALRKYHPSYVAEVVNKANSLTTDLSNVSASLSPLVSEASHLSAFASQAVTKVEQKL